MLSNGFLDYCQNGTDFVIRAKNRDYLLGYLDAMAYEVGKIVGRTVISENYFHITCTLQ